jgi:nitrite reductase (NAD(P)H)
MKLPPVEELDSVLGTEKWKVKKGEAPDPFQKVDKRYKGMRGKKACDISTQAPTTQAANIIDW